MADMPLRGTGPEAGGIAITLPERRHDSGVEHQGGSDLHALHAAIDVHSDPDGPTRPAEPPTCTISLGTDDLVTLPEGEARRT